MPSLLDKLMSVDTWLNVIVFVFIGLMVWLYFKDVKEDGSEENV